jgi:hypothetical protein
MKRLITQKHPMGCGIACIAAVIGSSYEEVIKTSRITPMRAMTVGMTCKDIVRTLRLFHRDAEYCYIKRRFIKRIYKEGSIVFIAPSKRYLYGHYLCRLNGQWMDPWINASKTNWDMTKASAGFRKRLPGKAIYLII